MTGNVPATFPMNTAGGSGAANSSYYRPAQAHDWGELKERLDEAVREGRLTQAQVNRILARAEQR